MGCGCVTPGSTIHRSSNHQVHSIKITRLENGSKRKIGERYFGQGETIKSRKFTHGKNKQIKTSKKKLYFDTNLQYITNTYGSSKSLRRESITSIQDFKQSERKKQKNVKYQHEPKLSIELQNVGKTEFNEKGPLIYFQNQNPSPHKLTKKQKYLTNKIHTQNNYPFPYNSINPLSHKDINQLTDQNTFQSMKRVNFSRCKLPKIQRAHTEEQQQSNDPYLETLREIVLFGEKKDNQFRKKKTVMNAGENKKISIPEIDPFFQRFNFKKKKTLI